jgi:SAM-dependent methyltransferase
MTDIVDPLPPQRPLTYLLFVGCGRTGSTLVGQLLNCHPNILISTEARALQEVIELKLKLIDLIQNLADLAFTEYTKGIWQYDSPDQEKHTQRWQQDWRDTSKLKLPKKEIVFYIGDKKQGGNLNIVLNNPNAIDKAFEGLHSIPVTVIRNPHHVLKSYLKLNVDDLDGNFDKSCKTVVDDMLNGYLFVENHDRLNPNSPGLVINYEKLLENPRGWCVDICKKFDLECHEEWIQIVEKTVNTEKKPEELTKEELDAFRQWTGYERLLHLMKKEGIVLRECVEYATFTLSGISSILNNMQQTLAGPDISSRLARSKKAYGDCNSPRTRAVKLDFSLIGDILESPLKLLSCGSRNSYELDFLESLFSKVHVIGTDLSPRFRSTDESVLASFNATQDDRIVHCNVENFEGLEEKDFDLVFSSHNLEHLADPISHFKNLFPICKPTCVYYYILPCWNGEHGPTPGHPNFIKCTKTRETFTKNNVKEYLEEVTGKSIEVLLATHNEFSDDLRLCFKVLNP